MKKGTILFSILFLMCATVVPVYAENEPARGPSVSMAPPVYPYGTQVEVPSAEAMTFDLFVVRPLSIAGTLIGVGVSILATPFALASGTTKPVYNRLMTEPYHFTVCRPLGEGL